MEVPLVEPVLDRVDEPVELFVEDEVVLVVPVELVPLEEVVPDEEFVVDPVVVDEDELEFELGKSTFTSGCSSAQVFK